MSREEQIKNMAKAIHLNCHKGLTSTEAEMIAKWCYQEIDRVSLKNAREIFEEIEEKGKVDEPIVEYYILSYSELAELKNKYTEGGG